MVSWTVLVWAGSSDLAHASKPHSSTKYPSCTPFWLLQSLSEGGSQKNLSACVNSRTPDDLPGAVSGLPCFVVSLILPDTFSPPSFSSAPDSTAITSISYLE